MQRCWRSSPAPTKYAHCSTRSRRQTAPGHRQRQRPRQVVVAGHIAEIENVERAAGEAGLRTKRLTVASAFHSPIVAESSAPFADPNTLPLGESHLTVYANATAQPYGDDPTAQLADQVRQSVRFREMIQAMAADGVTRFIEVGPGRVLTGLVNQILGDTPHLAVALDDPQVADLRGWHRGLAALAADGVSWIWSRSTTTTRSPPSSWPRPSTR